MRASQAIALERLLEGEELGKKPAALLKGLGAKLVRASNLPAPRFGSSAAAGEESFLESCVLGLPAHTLIEVVGRRSSGRFSIGLAAMASSTASGESAALIDLGDNLDPQAAERAGIDLARILWVRPRRVKEALSAAEMLLATGFRLVVADLGLSPRGGRFVPDAAWVRLQRAARSQESTLLLLVPYRMSGIAADIVVSASAVRPLWQGNGRVPRLLTGIASRLMLERRGRETPGRSAPFSFAVAEAIRAGGRCSTGALTSKRNQAPDYFRLRAES
ncbi:MAG TPA: hypothetical protein VJA66_07100 [Thermoanaerobaculia bacterium]